MITLRNFTNDPFDLFFKDINVTSNNDPVYDVMETDDEYKLDFMLPAFDKNDFNIKVEDNTLIVEGERNVKDENYKSIRSYRGKFKKMFTIPDMVDYEKVSAKYENGVLMITMPKSEEKMKKRLITID